MAGRIIIGIANPALDANGAVDSGAMLTFYQNLTTTPQSVYTDSTLLTPLTNPLSCDAAGRFPQVWAAVGTLYSVKWTPTGATPITYDHISAAWDMAGTTTNDSAMAGSLGEPASNVVPAGSAVSLTTATDKNIASISLSAGDWEVNGVFYVTGQVGTITKQIAAAFGTTSGSITSAQGSPGRADMSFGVTGIALFAQGNQSVTPSSCRFSLAATTTVYLVGNHVFTTGTSSGFGSITARRVR